MVTSFRTANSLGSAPSQVPVTFNVLVGVAAPLLWTGQNTYVARCAAKAADLLQEPAEKWTTRLLSFLGFVAF